MEGLGGDPLLANIVEGKWECEREGWVRRKETTTAKESPGFQLSPSDAESAFHLPHKDFHPISPQQMLNDSEAKWLNTLQTHFFVKEKGL